MRIAILTERLKTGFGVDLVVHEQASRLAKNHEVVVFAIDIDQKFIESVNYTVYQLFIPLFFNPINQDISTHKRFDTYKHILSTFDRFIIHTPTYNAWTGKLKQFGKVITYYYGNSPSYGYVGMKKYRKKIFNTMENNLYFQQTNKIISISKFLTSDLKANLLNKTTVSHLGKEHVTKLYNKMTKDKLEKIWKTYLIEDKDKIITYIGRLDFKSNPYKNTYDLIKLRAAFPYEKDKKLKIFCIGFPQNNIEKEMYNAGISVVPTASPEDLVALLARSYIYFSPSLWEGFNLPFLEAQSLGIPVIGYKVGAHEEVVNLNKSGYLVNNFSEVVNKVEYLLENPTQQDKMSKQAINHADNFSWDKNVQQLEDVL